MISAFTLPTPAPGETHTPSWRLNNWGGLVDGGTESSDGIAAFVTILVFDSDFDLIKIISDQISSGASSMHDYMKAEYTIREAGYVYMYISNHSNTPQNVYFDDVRMTYEPSNVIQYNEYYAHGLPNANSWTRDNARGNRYLANGGTEFNDTTKLYDLDFRNFDPVLGRMNQVDPVAGKYAGLSPYNFSFNNPVGFVDPTGADPLYEESYYYAYAQSMGMDIGQYQRIMDYGSGGAAGAAYGRMAGVGEAGAMPQSYDAKIEANYKRKMILKGIRTAFTVRLKPAQSFSKTTTPSSSGTNPGGPRNPNEPASANGGSASGPNGSSGSDVQWERMEFDIFDNAQQRVPSVEQFIEFANFFFGRELGVVKPKAALNWEIGRDLGSDAGITTRQADGSILIQISRKALMDVKQLYLTIAHELVHAADLVNGNYEKYFKAVSDAGWTGNDRKFLVKQMMEYRAYSHSVPMAGQMGQKYYDVESVILANAKSYIEPWGLLEYVEE